MNQYSILPIYFQICVHCYAFFWTFCVRTMRATMSVCLFGIECIIVCVHNKKGFWRHNVSENELRWKLVTGLRSGFSSIILRVNILRWRHLGYRWHAISILRLRKICTLKIIVQECVTITRHHMRAVRVSHLLIVQNRFLANLLLNELFYLFTRITAVASFKRTLKTFLFRQEYGVINWH